MNSSEKSQKALFSALGKILRALVRLLLRNGVPYGAFNDILKRTYVDVATEEFDLPGRKQSKSRVATITGLSRKEIQRISKQDLSGGDQGSVVRYNRAARVVFAWVHEKKYRDSVGDILPLPFDADDISFSTLVKENSGDIPPRAILDELLEVGVVKKTGDKTIGLLQPAYIPTIGGAEKLALLGRDVAGLIATMDANIHNLNQKANFQRKVFYDNMTNESLWELKGILADKGQSLLEYLDAWMAQHDRDFNPKVKGSGRKAAGIGIYYFEEEE